MRKKKKRKTEECREVKDSSMIEEPMAKSVWALTELLCPVQGHDRAFGVSGF